MVVIIIIITCLAVIVIIDCELSVENANNIIREIVCTSPILREWVLYIVYRQLGSSGGRGVHT